MGVHRLYAHGTSHPISRKREGTWRMKEGDRDGRSGRWGKCDATPEKSSTMRPLRLAYAAPRGECQEAHTPRHTLKRFWVGAARRRVCTDNERRDATERGGSLTAAPELWATSLLQHSAITFNYVQHSTARHGTGRYNKRLTHTQPFAIIKHISKVGITTSSQKAFLPGKNGSRR